MLDNNINKKYYTYLPWPEQIFIKHILLKFKINK